MQIILGDAKDILPTLDEGSIDLVFTDPPYPREFKHTYQYLADYCPRLMKRGASLITIAPHYLLEEVMMMFYGKLKYRWVLNMDQFEGNHARLGMGIEVCWKPMLWYVKEAFTKDRYRGFIKDGIKISGRSGIKKKLHKWEQDPDWGTYYIERLTRPGQTVLDPYMGSGTTAEICQRLGLNYIGIDIDGNNIETVWRRLENGSVQERHDSNSEDIP